MAGWRQHRQLLRKCIARPSGKAIHELRIATRRLLARLELCPRASRASMVKPHRRKLKQLMRDSAPARDARVQADLFDQLVCDHQDPGFKLIHAHLKKLARRLTHKLARRLARYDRAAPTLPVEFPPSLAPATARILIKRRFRRLQAHLREAAPGESTAQHRARLALKKLRYLLEVLATEGASRLPPGMDSLQAVQSSLGKLHDFDLLLDWLETRAARHKRTKAWLSPQRSTLWLRRESLHLAIPPCRVRLADLLPPASTAGPDHRS